MLSNLGKCAFIGAHPDDIEINAGGTIARLAREGAEITVIIVTLGGGISNELENCTTRKREAEASIELLNSSYPHSNIKLVFLNFRDTRLSSMMPEMTHALHTVLKQYGPHDTVFTHFDDTHTDHSAVYRSTIAAARGVKNLLFYRPTYPGTSHLHEFQTNMIVQLDDEDANMKILMLAHHGSQVDRYGKEDYLDSVRALTRAYSLEYAGKIGYAETFQVCRLRF